MCRGGTSACFHRSDLQSKKFSYTNFIVKNWPLYVISAYPLLKIDDFGSTPRVSMRFCGHLPNSSKKKNPNRLIPYLLEKVVLLDPKNCCPSRARAKKLFFQL
jgi:hypothetical protein